MSEVAQTSNPPCIEEHLHKNRLQEYTQKSNLPLPNYFTINEESAYGIKFISSVVVNGEIYKSPQAFNNRKEAEQDAARVAYENILKKIKDEGIPHIHVDTTFCKSILNEFAVKMKLERPIYSTTAVKGLLLVFISTVVFDGKTYTGNVGKNKKEAEQLGARSVIEHFLGTASGRALSEIINSKHKLYAALHKVKETRKVSLMSFPEASGQVINVPAKALALALPEIKKPKLEPLCETSKAATEDTTSVSDQLLSGDQVEAIASQSLDVDSNADRKRKKNRDQFKLQHNES